MEGQAYLDIVWAQFRKSRVALAMLWLVAGLFLIAILAPFIASNQPFWFREGDRLLFPWLVSLLRPESVIDYIFNVALLMLIPAAAILFLLNRRWRAKALPGRRRVARMAVGLALALPTACILLLAVRAPNRYFDRDFKRDQLQGKGNGCYAPVPFGPFEIDLDVTYRPPLIRRTGEPFRYREAQVHLLGTDDNGRDVFCRLLYGTRISMTIGIVAVSLYVTIGIVMGALAGYFGGRVDMLISRLVEIIMLFPSLFLILTLVALFERSIYIIMVVIGVTGWPGIARLIRGEFLRQRAVDYVAAARALGASNSRVIFRHILPNAISPALVAVPFGVAGAIVTEASLSVLGLGVLPPTPTWGTILQLALSNNRYWWFTLFAGLSIFITVSALNLVGNAFRDAMDPRLKGTQ